MGFLACPKVLSAEFPRTAESCIGREMSHFRNGVASSSGFVRFRINTDKACYTDETVSYPKRVENIVGKSSPLVGKLASV
jgi:hypothetical protein